jgi:hypothetical protein
MKINYAKPEIRDYGTLTELTEICAAPGTGDSVFNPPPIGPITLPNGTTSIGVFGSSSFCVSSGLHSHH